MPSQSEPYQAADLGLDFQEALDRQAGHRRGQESEAPTAAQILEAVLFVGGAPLTLERAGEIIRGLTSDQFHAAIDALNHAYKQQGRPYTMQPVGEGFVLKLKPRFRGLLEKLYGTTREAHLSTAAVDVLALVAYRQPVSKQEVDSLRGAESGALLRQLVRRGLIAVVQRAEAQRREVAYGTTSRFLELFGLSSLEDLPRAQDLNPM
jgi:segregation and condensation protein B